jgi:hypothetical protein
MLRSQLLNVRFRARLVTVILYEYTVKSAVVVTPYDCFLMYRNCSLPNQFPSPLCEVYDTNQEVVFFFVALSTLVAEAIY